MNDWYLLTLAVSIFITSLLFSHISHHRKRPPLPPGPRLLLLTLARSNFHIEPFHRRLIKKHGPIFSIKFIRQSAIFIADRTRVHQALIQHSATFADRLKANVAARILNSSHRSISSVPYSPVWRPLRRNLTAKILHPSRVRMYAPAKKWMLSILRNRQKAQMERDGSVVPMKSFQLARSVLVACAHMLRGKA